MRVLRWLRRRLFALVWPHCPRCDVPLLNPCSGWSERTGHWDVYRCPKCVYRAERWQRGRK